MSKQKYTKPLAQALDRTLAVSIGGCSTGITPGACSAPIGYNAGTCVPGNGVGGTCGVGNFPGMGSTCGAGFQAYPCTTGTAAGGGCGPLGQNANAPETPVP
jgi:hypothetical protein